MTDVRTDANDVPVCTCGHSADRHRVAGGCAQQCPCNHFRQDYEENA